jgi:hypothetical protein
MMAWPKGFLAAIGCGSWLGDSRFDLFVLIGMISPPRPLLFILRSFKVEGNLSWQYQIKWKQ